jgi:hypothetical protein
MTNKNPFVVFLLVFVTLGIYAVVWYVKAGREMRRRGADVPTAWLMIIPIVSIYWFIKWCAGVGKVGAMNGFLAALLLIFLLLLNVKKKEMRLALTVLPLRHRVLQRVMQYYILTHTPLFTSVPKFIW